MSFAHLDWGYEKFSLSEAVACIDALQGCEAVACIDALRGCEAIACLVYRFVPTKRLVCFDKRLGYRIPLTWDFTVTLLFVTLQQI